MLISEEQSEHILREIAAPDADAGSTILGEDGYSYEDDLLMLKCLVTLQNFTTNIIRYPFWSMIDNSAQDLFDIGSAEGCHNLNAEGGNSKYAIMDIEMNTVPSKIKVGLCLPKQCSQQVINRMQEKFNRVVQPFCRYIFDVAIIDPKK